MKPKERVSVSKQVRSNYSSVLLDEMIQRDLDENLACGSPRLLKFLVHPALPYFNENNLN